MALCNMKQGENKVIKLQIHFMNAHMDILSHSLSAKNTIHIWLCITLSRVNNV